MAKLPEKPPLSSEIQKEKVREDKSEREKPPETREGLVKLAEQTIGKIKTTAENVIKTGRSLLSSLIEKVTGGASKDIVRGERVLQPVQNEIRELSERTQREITKEITPPSVETANIGDKKDLSDLSKLENLANEKNRWRRKTVAEALSNFKVDERTLSILKKLIHDEDFSVQKAVYETLSKLDFSKSSSEIGKRILDDLNEVINTKKDLCKDMKNPLLVREVNKEILQIATEAKVKIIVDTKGKEGLWDLKRMTNDEDPFTRKTVAKALSNPIFDNEAVSILDKMVNDEAYEVVTTAAEARVRIATQGKEALSELDKLAERKNPFIQEEVAKVLPKYGEKGLSIFKKLAESEDIGVLKIVIENSSNYGEEGLLILEKLAGHQSGIVRETVAENLHKFGKESLSILEKLTDDNDEFVRRKVAQNLDKFFNLGKEAMPILKKILEKMAGDKDPFVQKKVTEFKEKIDKEVGVDNKRG